MVRNGTRVRVHLGTNRADSTIRNYVQNPHSKGNGHSLLREQDCASKRKKAQEAEWLPTWLLRMLLSQTIRKTPDGACESDERPSAWVSV